MQAQIRLAERQGLLTGTDLCLLQVTSVYYCEIVDMAAERENERHGFKLALLSTGRMSVDELFPEMFTQTDDSADLDDDEDVVTYRFAEQGELSPEEMERELQALLRGGDFTVNGGELDGLE